MINWLEECVYYPCSGLHGTPVKLLSKRFNKFLYIDYMVDSDQLHSEMTKGFKGYKAISEARTPPELVIGKSWHDYQEEHRSQISKIPFTWENPFIVLYKLERMQDYDERHGPLNFEFMFCRSEAVSSYLSIFSQKRITPKCLVHIRSGMGFGGNYSKYPTDLGNAVLNSRAGLPQNILYDCMGSTPGYGDYLDIISKYRALETWGYPDGGKLTLAELTIAQTATE